MKKHIYVRQQDITDCGAACLASVAAWFRLNLPVAKIRQLANTDKQGTTMLGMLEAAEKLGFIAKGIKGSYECLSDIPKPSIMHVIVDGGYHHYKVLYRINKNSVQLMDPIDGKLHKLDHDAFRKEWTGVALILVPSPEFKPMNNNWSPERRFIALMWPHKSIILQCLSGAVVYSILGLTTSVYVQKIVDHVLVDGNVNLLNTMSMLMFIFLFLKIFISISKSIFTLRTGQQIDATLIMGYYRHLLKLPQRFFDTMRVGEIISRINDAVRIRSFINNVSLDIAVNLMIVFFSCTFMFMFSWKMAVITILAIPFYVSLYLAFNMINKKVLRRIMENSADLESHLVESLNTIMAVKQFSVSAYTNLKTETRFFRLLRSVYTASKSTIITQGLSELLAGIMIISVLWVGSLMVIHNEFTSGTLLSFYALLGYLLGPVSYLIHASQGMQDALIAADRLFQIMDLECEETYENKICLTREMIGDIHFRHVSFRYGSRLQVFDNLNLTFSKGEISAIIGESGSGKTSLIALLENLYPLQSGIVEIGNYNLQQIQIDSLRSQIGIVPQQIELISATIAENIAFGEAEPDMRRIIDICGMLNMREFIEKIPGSYNAALGEHGISLSGGERQRLAIARALYRDPEILIFDEATSALDATAEAHVRQMIRTMKTHGKTILIITHRFRSIMYADKIFVLHKGRIMEEGNHQTLMAGKGYYFNLWKQQFPMLEEVPD
jgi:ATP-binding cassette, subfamily C, bacteriocin exporter